MVYGFNESQPCGPSNQARTHSCTHTHECPCTLLQIHVRTHANPCMLSDLKRKREAESKDPKLPPSTKCSLYVSVVSQTVSLSRTCKSTTDPYMKLTQQCFRCYLHCHVQPSLTGLLACLKSTPVSHHAFYCVCDISSCKGLQTRFAASNHWNGRHIDSKVPVYLDHLPCLCFSFFCLHVSNHVKACSRYPLAETSYSSCL